MPSGEEIHSALRKFAARWSSYRGSERGEAQTFLNELVACYGADRRAVGGVFEDPHVAPGDAHRALDEAVVTAYGWPPATTRDPADVVRRLLGLNREIASGARAYEPFPAPGDRVQPSLQLGSDA